MSGGSNKRSWTGNFKHAPGTFSDESDQMESDEDLYHSAESIREAETEDESAFASERSIRARSAPSTTLGLSEIPAIPCMINDFGILRNHFCEHLDHNYSHSSFTTPYEYC